MKTHHGLYENAESAIRTAYLKLKRIDCPEKELRRAVLLHTEERERERERERKRERTIHTSFAGTLSFLPA